MYFYVSRHNRKAQSACPVRLISIRQWKPQICRTNVRWPALNERCYIIQHCWIKHSFGHRVASFCLNSKFELCHLQCTYPTSWFFLHSNLVKKTAFWNKRVVLWQLAFWTRKAIRKITTCLFCKASLFICCKWNKKKNNCKISCLETSLFWRYKEYYVTRNTRNGPLASSRPVHCPTSWTLKSSEVSQKNWEDVTLKNLF